MIDALATNLNFIPAKLSRNDISHVIDAANPALTSRVGLKYYLEIQVPQYDGSTSFVKLHASQLREKPPYAIGTATVYEGAGVIYNQRAGKLDSLLSVQKPTPDLNEPMVITSQSKQFKLREIVTGGTPAVNTSVLKPAQWVVKAGINEVDYVSFSENYFSSYQLSARKFLSNQPNDKFVGSKQTEYLSFLMNINPMPTAVRLRIEVDNKTTTTFMTVVNPPFMSVLLFPINIENLSFEECKCLKVWLSDENNNRISEVRQYYIDDTARKQERAIVFSNSLGGWDTLRLTGEANENIKVTQNALSVEKSAFQPTRLDSLRVVSTDADKEITISTGYFERKIKDNLAYLEELLLSEDIYLDDEKGHRQLKRLTNTMVLKEDSFGNVARIFQFQFVDKIKNYSVLPVATAPISRSTGWAAFGNQQCLLDSFGKRNGYKRPESLVKIYTDDSRNVKPLTVKANTSGTEGYINQYFDTGITVGSTPYPSALYSRLTSLKKNNCTSGYDGLAATISIAAGTYGGEVAGDGDLLAIAAANALDTQTYANTYGACTPIGPIYDWSVPANHWHFRVKEPAKMAIRYQDMGFGSYPAGNDISMQSQSGAYIYPVGSNDLNFPVSGPPNYLGWGFILTGYTPNSTKQFKGYKNGVLAWTDIITFDSAGNLTRSVFVHEDRIPAFGYAPSNNDKYYWEIV